jgi:hypothetical protein
MRIIAEPGSLTPRWVLKVSLSPREERVDLLSGDGLLGGRLDSRKPKECVIS